MGDEYIPEYVDKKALVDRLVHSSMLLEHYGCCTYNNFQPNFCVLYFILPPGFVSVQLMTII